jgi:uncharacterized membrane protein YeaQ/YmgE (transglycosylase-associated protein family)
VSTLPLLSEAVVVVSNDESGVVTNLIIWLLVGLVAGFLATKIVNKPGKGAIYDVALGLIGAVIGGALFRLFGMQGEGTILVSIVVATLGAVVALVLYHKLKARLRPA